MHVPRPIYWLVRRLVPIACADALPFHRDDGATKVGLIRRKGEEGKRSGWALVGGGIRRGETVAQALRRHLDEALAGEGLDWRIPDTAHPLHAAEYSPRPKAGQRPDPRKHAVALSYLVERTSGEVEEWRGEAEHFEWRELDALPPPAEFAFGHGSIAYELVRRLEGEAGSRATGADVEPRAGQGAAGP